LTACKFYPHSHTARRADFLQSQPTQDMQSAAKAFKIPKNAEGGAISLHFAVFYGKKSQKNQNYFFQTY